MGTEHRRDSSSSVRISPSTARGLEPLSREECFALLHANSLGRIALRIGDSPAILPVNYALLDEDIVFRTDPGSKLSAALMQVLVAFEIDQADAATHGGWSVLVTGYANEVCDRETLDRVAALGLDSWGDSGRDFVVRITPRAVSGRRLATT